MGMITKTFSITALGEFLIQSDLNHWCLWIFFFNPLQGWISIFVHWHLRGKRRPSAARQCSRRQQQCILGVWSKCIFKELFRAGEWLKSLSLVNAVASYSADRQKTTILIALRATIIIKNWFKCIFLPAVKWTDLRHIIIIFNHAANLISFAFFNLCELSELLFADVSFFFGTLKLVFSLNESIKRSQFFKKATVFSNVTCDHAGFLSRRVKSGIITSFNKNCRATTLLPGQRQ